MIVNCARATPGRAASGRATSSRAEPRQAGPRQAQSFAAGDALQAIAGLEAQIGAGAGRVHGVAAGAEDASLQCDRGHVTEAM
ncbi:hypothetical protein QYQ99_25170 [Comamonas testosteroni]|uniref:hypothetical protein n=1 Tax=Comamonas testosteroni TaxID=285 RepID=UPI0026600E10|nr:hypothetical protein [Comamonas testosteroni]WKL15581.1 hypothetical protein QYQ99_25170 [Comamonas testosteroni]